tara:strand:- start:6710 stop:7273 length:564 start_codon:yes stop_codon:yes gene_type:complete
MNNKEVFWSLMSPYIINRGNSHRKVDWDLDYLMNHPTQQAHGIGDIKHGLNGDFIRWLIGNCKFVMPTNLIWRDDYIINDRGRHYINFNKFPRSLIIQRFGNTYVRQVYVILDEVLIKISLRMMSRLRHEYEIADIKQYKGEQYHWAMDGNIGQVEAEWTGRDKYAIVFPIGQFINWIDVSPLEGIK